MGTLTPTRTTNRALIQQHSPQILQFTPESDTSPHQSKKPQKSKAIPNSKQGGASPDLVTLDLKQLQPHGRDPGARQRRPRAGSSGSWICSGVGRIWERAVAARSSLALSSFLFFASPLESSRLRAAAFAYPFFPSRGVRTRTRYCFAHER
jgi:hypothetical protein